MLLAALTLAAWAALMAVLLARRQLRDAAPWLPWDVLRGARRLRIEGLSDSLTLRLSVVGEACERALQAHAAAGLPEAQALAKAALATARVLVAQLDAELLEFGRHARVLQAAATLAPVRPAALRTGTLRPLARTESLLRAGRGPLGRLRVHLWALRLGLALLTRRVARFEGRPNALPEFTEAQADLVTLARETVACSRVLVASLQASRDRLAETRPRDLARTTCSKSPPPNPPPYLM